MKPLSIRKVAMAALAVVFLSAFRSDPQRQIPLCTSNGNVHYYFYLDDGDTFDAYNTVGDEITRLEVLLGAFIDTNPSGGYEVARGYINNNYPHTIWPSAYLFEHD
ncbi:MAG TPA: hypothetical protein VHC96_23600 [Puia sp.]|nr:hypothetical protein [Puia sp.]